MARRFTDPPQGLFASSQPSRFHDSGAASASQLVDIHDVTLSIGQKDLLTGAHIKLAAGVHYGLIGRNGVGKSTVLKALAHRWIPGAPRNITICYIDQMDERGDALDAPVLDMVLAADAAQAQCAAQIASLEAALAANTATGMRDALHAHRHAHLAAEVADAREASERVSGARGVAARSKLKGLESQLAAFTLDTPDAQVEGALQEELHALYERATLRAEREANAEAILTELGFTHAQARAPVRELSSGWRIRVAMATARFVAADIILLVRTSSHQCLRARCSATEILHSTACCPCSCIRSAFICLAAAEHVPCAAARKQARIASPPLLNPVHHKQQQAAHTVSACNAPPPSMQDEPTNALDLPGIMQLRSIVDTLLDTTLVIVSHDRAFLDATVDEIILLQAGKLAYFDGNYSAYAERLQGEQAMRARQRDTLARKHDKIQVWLQVWLVSQATSPASRFW